MGYRRFGRTALKVSYFCLGTMQWNWTTDETTAEAVMDAFVEHGGNFLDTADFYSRWLPGHSGGEAEEIIGHWIQRRATPTRCSSPRRCFNRWGSIPTNGDFLASISSKR